MKRWIGLGVILAFCEPAQAMTVTLPATASQFLVEAEASSPPAAIEPARYNPALAAALSYLPGLATGVLLSAAQPAGTSIGSRALLATGLTLANPFCGLGQAYVNEPARGFSFLTGSVLASIAAYTVALGAGMAGVRDTTSAVEVGAVLLLPVGLAAWSAYDAYHLAGQKNSAAEVAPTASPAVRGR